MPLTSYALKALGSSIGWMLTAVVLVTALVASGTSAAAPAGPSPIYAFHSVGRATSLVKLNALTLKELGRLPVDRAPSYAFSPDRRFLALGGTRLVVIDLERLEVLWSRPLDRDYRFRWPARRQIVGFAEQVGPPSTRHSFVIVIDPVARRTVREHALGRERLLSLRSIGGRAVLLTATTERWWDIGGPLHLITVRASGALNVKELPIRLGYDDLQVTSPGDLPAKAADAASATRNDLATRKGIAPEEVRVLSVVAYRVPRVYSLGHRVVLEAKAEYWEYSRHVVTGYTTGQQIAGPPKPPPNDLLRAPRASWIARSAVLVPSRPAIARVIASPGFVTRQSRIRKVGALRGAWDAFTVDARTLAVAVEKGVVLFDLTSGRHRLIRTRCEIAAGHGRLVLFGRPCQGIRAYDGAGRPSFRSKETAEIVRFQIRGRYGYLWSLHGSRLVDRYSVIDLKEGRRVKRRDAPRDFVLLP